MRNARLAAMSVFAILFGAIGWAATAFSEQAVPILVYHRFDLVKSGLTTIPTNVFQRQLDWLDAHNYHVVPLHMVVDWLGRTGPAPLAPAVVITVDDGNVSDFTQLYPIILHRHLHVTLFIYPSAISNASYALSWAQLKEMEKSGLVDVQSHTYWHPNFRNERAHRSPANYSAFVNFQLSHSKTTLEHRLDVQVSMLAWPYGIYDPLLEAAARKAGYQYAFAFAGGLARLGVDPLAIPRIPISGFTGVGDFPWLVAQHLSGKSE